MLYLWRKWSKRWTWSRAGGRRRVAAAVAAGSIVAAGMSAVLAGLASPSAWAGTVTVQRGQTLTEIAAELHTTVAALMTANQLQNPNRILAGQRLEVPSPTAESGNASTTVVVQRGQTLFAIAARFGVSVSALAAANGISNPNHVLSGTRLVVPQGASGMALADDATPIAGTDVAVGGLPTQLADNPSRLTLEPDFASAAATYGVSLPLLEALCWWESGWQVAIVSPDGAVGVCQVEPATAAFVDQFLVDTDLNPSTAAQNIDLGAAYLASLLRQTAGNVSEALAGYYQGLASVRQQGMSAPTDTYVEGVEAYASIFAR